MSSSSRKAHLHGRPGTTSLTLAETWVRPIRSTMMTSKEFVELQATFADSEKSWTVEADQIDQSSFDLSVKNPNNGEEVPLRDPLEILAEIEALDAESAEVLEGIRGML